MTEPRWPVDALVAEIGSTTTVVSAFAGLRDYPAATPCLVGQGVAATSVADGDVTIGVNAARAQLEAAVGLRSSPSSRWRPARPPAACA